MIRDTEDESHLAIDQFGQDYDADEERFMSSHSNGSSSGQDDPIGKHWRIFLVLTGASFCLFAVFACLLFLRISDQSGEEEMRAARGVADVAMALAFTDLKHIQPHNQNWSYSELIRLNLQAILPPQSTSFAEFDAHGQFADCKYMLRIYQQSGSTHFLVIAQPEHGWFFSFVPKASIVLDSRSMELHKIQDLKALNRLLVDSQNIDGVNANEIASLVKRAELIPLVRLANGEEGSGFVPPKALGLTHPGAENKVYNAPRYYLFGESLLESIVSIGDSLNIMTKNNAILEEIISLSRFPNFVFYSSKGIEYVLEARKQLTTLMRNEDFLVAYLQFNETRNIVSAHLLMSDFANDIAYTSRSAPVEQVAELAAREDVSLDGFSLIQEEDSVDFDDRLFLQLSSMAHTRQLALMPISDELINLLEQHSYQAQGNFAESFARLTHQYEATVRDQEEKMIKKFDQLVHEYGYLPAARFISFIKAADLQVSFVDYLDWLKAKSPEKRVSDEQVALILRQIDESTTWAELEEVARAVNRSLRFNTILNVEHLIAYQNAAWASVTKKLNEFILPSESSFYEEHFSAKNLQLMISILKDLWITNPLVYDFYTVAFVIRMQQ